MDNRDPKEYIWIDPQSAPREEASAATLFQLVIPHAISTASSK
jgi:hypothetical protein